METLEIIIYIVIALIVGSIFLLAVKNWNYIKEYRSIKNILGGTDDDESGLKEITKDILPQESANIWERCGFGDKELSRTFYMQGENLFTKSDFFRIIKKLGKCNILQYNLEECGTRDNVIMNDIKLPAVVKVYCDTVEKKLMIK